jgi:RNA polymerase sigma-70 factor (ECF subfamily)
MPDARGSGAAADLYAQAVAEFGATLERLARGYERDPDRRRDLLQEIHVALWRSLGRFDGRCSLRTWIYRIAHNTATSKALRPRFRRPAFGRLDDLTEEPAAADPRRVADQERIVERLMTLVHQLTPLDRQVMLLYLEDEQAASIGEITGMTPGAVATKIHRIKKLLATRFHEGAGNER